ncbi:MAG TPA: IS1595 family transposase [Rhizomicrobium sp.]|nr:IS1595 family transposase [Rhizomicrobium sp.]
MTADLTNQIFSNEAKALEHMENDRWPGGVVTCPLCGVVGEARKMGGATQTGMFLCNACRGKFTVRTGTVFERSHIPLHKWLLATHLMASSKKGISAHQLHRMLGITYKSAWFMAHRIREAMAPARNAGPLGGEGSVIEADEYYISKPDSEHETRTTKGRPYTKSGRTGMANKRVVVSLVERGGRARSFHMKEGATKLSMADLLRANVHPASRLHTDESALYVEAEKLVAKHERVHHGKGEYARGDVTTNSVEGYFGVFTRGLVGTYQHVSEQHLSRYLAEFDFRQSNRVALGVHDVSRAARILKGAEGKRLTYRQVS